MSLFFTAGNRPIFVTWLRALFRNPFTQVAPMTWRAVNARTSGGVLQDVTEDFGRALAVSAGTAGTLETVPTRMQLNAAAKTTRLRCPLGELRITTQLHVLLVAAIRTVPAAGTSKGLLEFVPNSTSVNNGATGISKIRYTPAGGSVTLVSNIGNGTGLVSGTMAINTPTIIELGVQRSVRRLMRLNGVASYDLTSGAGVPTVLDNLSFLNIASAFSTATHFGDIDIQEVRVYRRLLEDAEAATVRAALGAAYGITTI